MPVENINIFFNTLEDFIKAPYGTINRVVIRFSPVIIPKDGDISKAYASEYIRFEKISQQQFQILHYPEGAGLYQIDGGGYQEMVTEPLSVVTPTSRVKFRAEFHEIIKVHRDKIVSCHSIIYADSGEIINVVGDGIF